MGLEEKKKGEENSEVWRAREREEERQESSGQEGNRYNFTAEHARQRAVVRQTGFHT